MDSDWNTIVSDVAEILETKENHQRRLGERAHQATELYGVDGLNRLVDDVEEQGTRISLSSLRNYRWVWETTHDLELPEDLSYRTLQTIAASGKPQFWAERIKNEGLSSAQVYHLIKADKGETKAKKSVRCPHCGTYFDL